MYYFYVLYFKLLIGFISTMLLSFSFGSSVINTFLYILHSKSKEAQNGHGHNAKQSTGMYCSCFIAHLPRLSNALIDLILFFNRTCRCFHQTALCSTQFCQQSRALEGSFTILLVFPHRSVLKAIFYFLGRSLKDL